MMLLAFIECWRYTNLLESDKSGQEWIATVNCNKNIFHEMRSLLKTGTYIYDNFIPRVLHMVHLSRLLKMQLS